MLSILLWYGFYSIYCWCSKIIRFLSGLTSLLPWQVAKDRSREILRVSYTLGPCMECARSQSNREPECITIRGVTRQTSLWQVLSSLSFLFRILERPCRGMWSSLLSFPASWCWEGLWRTWLSYGSWRESLLPTLQCSVTLEQPAGLPDLHSISSLMRCLDVLLYLMGFLLIYVTVAKEASF